MSTESSTVKIVIVGAGAAGLAAASKLYEHRDLFDVVVLEAEDRIGGRICSHQMENGWIELGAQWIHGEQHWLYDYASDHNLLAKSVQMSRETGFLLEDGKSLSAVQQNQVAKLTDRFDCQFAREALTHIPASVSAGELLNQLRKTTLEDCTDEHSRQITNAVTDWTNRCMKVEWGADSLDDVSVQTYRDEICIGNYNHQFNAPYSQLLDHLLKSPSGSSVMFPRDRIRLNSPVSAICLDSDRAAVDVRLENGDTARADHVIVTVSLGVLKARHREMFVPKLSDVKQKAIDSMGYGMIGKVALFYQEPFWTKWKFDYVEGDTRSLALLWDWGTGDETADPERRYGTEAWFRAIRNFLVCETHPNILIAFIAGRQTLTMETMPEDRLMKDLTDLLRRFTNEANLPSPVRILRSDWASNQRFLGTYSYISKESGEQGHSPSDLATPEWGMNAVSSGNELQRVRDKVPRLLFAGEATHPQYFSMVHGAILSGRREADRLLLAYREKIQRQPNFDRCFGHTKFEQVQSKNQPSQPRN